jgi:hypothetical protein
MSFNAFDWERPIQFSTLETKNGNKIGENTAGTELLLYDATSGEKSLSSLVRVSSVDVEWTGTPTTDIALTLTTGSVLIPRTAGTGAAVEVADISPGILTLTIANDSGIETIELPGIKTIGTSGLSINTCSALTDVSLPLVHTIAGPVLFDTCAALDTVALPLLTACTTLTVENCDALVTLSLPLLGSVTSMSVANSSDITEVSLPALAASYGAVTFDTCPALDTLTLTVLARCAALTIDGTALVTISLPALSRVAAWTVANCTVLTDVSAPSITTATGNITMSDTNGAIENVTLGAIGTTLALLDIDISGQALTEASVDAILALLVSLDGTGSTTLWGAGRTLDLSGGTSAAPSVTGAADALVLTGRTATVTTN